jgi:transcriptional regulator of arginine metabolism
MSVKARRHARIREIVAARPLHSQDELAALLARERLPATQATLSRDLRELGVLKGPDGYRLPERAAHSPAHAPADHASPAIAPALQRALRAFLMRARPASSLVVLRTGPGQASALALELDRTPPSGALGTVAGDDTVFVATESPASAKRLARALERASR